MRKSLWSEPRSPTGRSGFQADERPIARTGSRHEQAGNFQILGCSIARDTTRTRANFSDQNDPARREGRQT